MAVFAPTPRASVKTATAVNAGTSDEKPNAMGTIAREHANGSRICPEMAGRLLEAWAPSQAVASRRVDDRLNVGELTLDRRTAVLSRMSGSRQVPDHLLDVLAHLVNDLVVDVHPLHARPYNRLPIRHDYSQARPHVRTSARPHV